ncbi:TssA family type VI secretion system protein [Pseudomonas aestusnigri]|uniref:TssA family type VI secretion system protein n=1 Tax=Halopseudomonas aestusnigri TaxID=857252 RepID=UPI001D191EFF|nr:TssA family type VI secretion system protein [Halopseudomonas aestusnigri]MCC4260691.1 TssA family type VI secretion system protein [Halopseudomonas aestusnigri]
MASVAVTPGNRPAADLPDLRDCDAYVRLEQVFSLLDSPHQQPQPDWQQLADTASDLLARGMDLRVAGWRTFALIRLQQLEQAVGSLQQIASALSSAWESSLPARARARLAALQWLQRSLVRQASALCCAKHELPVLQSAMHAIGSALHAHSVPLSKDWHQLAGSLAPAASERTESAAPEPASSAPSREPAPERDSIGNERAAQQQLRRLQEAATPLLQWWLSQPDQRVSALQMSRCLTWGGIGQLPRHDEQKHTSLRPPPAERIKHYDTLWQQQEYARLLHNLENSLRKAPFWLDGHYLAARCCHAMDDANAASVIQAHTRSLVQRLPGLECLCFDDGSPFASRATQAWLQPPADAQQQSQPDNATEGDTAAPLRSSVPADTAMPAGQTDERQRALSRLQWARRLLANARHREAEAMLEPQLAQLQQSMPLAIWDKQLLSETLQLLHQSLVPRRDSTSQERCQALQQQLHWLSFQDPLEQATRPEPHGEAL